MSNKPDSVMAAVLRPAPDEVARQNVARDLETYVRAMTLGTPVDSKAGGEMQRMLWRTIKACLREEGPSFLACWGLLLSTINEYRGEGQAFSEVAVYRFADSMPLSAEDMQCFQRLIHLLINTCNPATRKLKVRHVDLNLVGRGLPGAQLDKIKAFYTDY